jgi:hypothetical protein
LSSNFASVASGAPFPPSQAATTKASKNAPNIMIFSHPPNLKLGCSIVAREHLGMVDRTRETVLCNMTNTAQPLLRHERLEDFNASISGREECFYSV